MSELSSLITRHSSKTEIYLNNDITEETMKITAIKTAARTKPAIFKMKGPVVLHKWGWADFGSVE